MNQKSKIDSDFFTNFVKNLFQMPIDTTLYVFSLPTWGAPYIAGKIIKKETPNILKILQNVVMGDIEGFSATNFVLHPTFCSTNKRWNAVRQCLTSKKVKVYVNENGYDLELQPNMATILKIRGVGGCPHLLGNVCVVVPQSVLTSLGYTEDQFSLFHPPRELDPDEYPIWDFEDEEDEEKQKALWATTHPNYDYNGETGYSYKQKM